MDSLRAQNVHKPLFKITQIESSIDSLSQANQVNINDKTITSDSDTLSEVTLSSVSSDENTKKFHSGKWSKLENILFDKNNPKIIDFGFATFYKKGKKLKEALKKTYTNGISDFEQLQTLLKPDKNGYCEYFLGIRENYYNLY